jgi:hypothetical protein
LKQSELLTSTDTDFTDVAPQTLLLVVPVPPVVIPGGYVEDDREPRRLRLLREDGEILAVIMAIHGETTWRA